MLVGIGSLLDRAIVARERDFLAHGGRLIFPLPMLRVVSEIGEMRVEGTS